MDTSRQPPTRPRPRRAPRLITLAAVALTLSAAACIETEEPPWWGPEGIDGSDRDVIAPGGDGGIGLTARVAGQACSECEDSTCPDWRDPPLNALQLHFIDVGQGDAIYIRTPTGEDILVDAGDSGFFERTNGGEYVADYLASVGLPDGSALDALVITHAHSDHFGGVLTLLDRAYTFGALIEPGLEATSPLYQGLITRLRDVVPQPELHRPALTLTANSGENTLVDVKGGATDLFGAAVDAWLLSSEPNMRMGDTEGARVNNTSVVLRLSYAGKHVLLTGDMEMELEAEMVQRFGARDAEPTLDAHLVKIGHHGSLTSSTSIFLSTVWRDIPDDQQFGVIMSGRLSFSGVQLPREETVRQLQTLLPREQLFSTESGDADKTELETAGDDDVLAVIRSDGSMFVCYPNFQSYTDP